MAHRVVIKNVLATVNKSALIATFRASGVGTFLPERINIVRSGPLKNQPECTVFLTVGNEQQIHRAVQILHGQVIHPCSSRPVVAEEATPRMTTLREKRNQLALCDHSQVVQDSELWQEKPRKISEGSHALGHWVKVKEENTFQKPDPAVNDGYSLEIPYNAEPKADQAHKRKKRKSESNIEAVSFEDEPPWRRRKKLRSEI